MAGKYIGLLTAGGDCPGLNAAVRAVGKAAHAYDMEVIGFLDGFRGLVENRTVPAGGHRPFPESSRWVARSSVPAATSPTGCPWPALVRWT